MNVTRPVVNCITRGRDPPAAGSINLERQCNGSVVFHIMVKGPSLKIVTDCQIRYKKTKSQRVTL